MSIKAETLLTWALVISVVGIVVILILRELDILTWDVGGTLEKLLNTLFGWIPGFFDAIGKGFSAVFGWFGGGSAAS